jgi:hypothetical protein
MLHLSFLNSCANSTSSQAKISVFIHVYPRFEPGPLSSSSASHNPRYFALASAISRQFAFIRGKVVSPFAAGFVCPLAVPGQMVQNLAELSTQKEL